MDFLAVLDRLGIAQQMKTRLRVVDSPVGAAAKGDAQFAVQEITDLMSEPRVDVVGPLPDDLPQTKIVYSAGVAVSTRQPEAANALLKFLRSPAAAKVIKAKGLQPALVD